MLGKTTTMLRALVVASLLAIPAVASAGTYVSLGLGGTGVDDSKSPGFVDNGRNVRLAVGYRLAPMSIGSISVEGGYTGFGVANGNATYDAHNYFAAGKFSLPLSQGFEAFGRLGVEHMDFSTHTNQPSLGGNGYLVGAGFEYRLGAIQGVPPFFANSGIWVDITRDGSSMTPDSTNGKARDIAVDTYTIGLSVGF
jgi:hypothetical protein